jgi:hypothetical protein
MEVEEEAVMNIKEIRLDDGKVIFVEVEEVALPRIPVASGSDDLPPGATPTGAIDLITDSIHLLKDTLRGVFDVVHASLKDHAPDEWGAELNISFKGTTSPIPVIVSGESGAAIKVHAKWVKPKA